jgi:hypothetical protein
VCNVLKLNSKGRVLSPETQGFLRVVHWKITNVSEGYVTFLLKIGDTSTEKTVLLATCATFFRNVDKILGYDRCENLESCKVSKWWNSLVIQLVWLLICRVAPFRHLATKMEDSLIAIKVPAAEFATVRQECKGCQCIDYLQSTHT